MKEYVKIKDKTFVPYLSNEEIMKAIDEVAAKINADFMNSGEQIVLVCTLNGSIMFTSELMKRLDFPCEFMAIKMSSYVGTQTTGNVKTAMGLTGDVSGKTVIVIEDIVDSGNTIVRLNEIMKEKGAAKVKLCTMLLKPELYKKDLKLDYVAKEIPNDFIVGFGLDYDEFGRNLSDIYVISK